MPESSWQLITTRREYQEAVAALIDEARMILRIFDADGRDLELNSRERCERLGAFLHQSRDTRLLLVLHSTDHAVRECPRLVDLLRRFSGQIAIHRTEGEAARARDCFVVADDLHIVRRAVHAQPRGAYRRDDSAEAQRMIERFDQLLEAAPIAVSATTLGL